MRVYETAFIINPQSDDATIDRQVKAVADIITGNGGKLLHEDRMGTRRMAYEILGLNQGYYTSIIFESEPTVPSILNRHYRLEEPYIRHLTILFEGDLEVVKNGGQELAGPGRYRPDSRRSESPATGTDSSKEEPTQKTTSAAVESDSKEPEAAVVSEVKEAEEPTVVTHESASDEEETTLSETADEEPTQPETPRKTTGGESDDEEL